MKSILPRYAGIIAAVLALTLIAGLFTIFGTVDLIFVKDGYEVKRVEGVSVIDQPELYTEDGVELQYSYDFSDVTYEYGKDFKKHVALTVLLNAITFQWDAEDNDITINVK